MTDTTIDTVAAHAPAPPTWRSALQKAGLQPERDYRLAVVPFGAQAGIEYLFIAVVGGAGRCHTIAEWQHRGGRPGGLRPSRVHTVRCVGETLRPQRPSHPNKSIIRPI